MTRAQSPMALDYYATTPDGEIRGSLTDAAVALCLPAFVALAKQTGVSPDPYGDTRLYPDHAHLLLESLPGTCPAALTSFRRHLLLAVEHYAVIHFSGD